VFVFTSPKDQPHVEQPVPRAGLAPGAPDAGLTGMHFHDLRHSDNILAASAGASLRELMDRMGHDSERATMIYLHGSDERKHAIADTTVSIAAGAPIPHISLGAILRSEYLIRRLGSNLTARTVKGY
jgi:site-specific recombinase XerD